MDQSLLSAKAQIATEILASVTDMCNQARNVRSLAKKTLGSILMGTLRGFGASTGTGLPKRPKVIFSNMPLSGLGDDKEPERG